MTESLAIRTEEHLLLNLCRLSFSDDQKDKLPGLCKCVKDWVYFVKQANEHGVIALAYNNLKTLDLLHLIPSEIISDLNNKHLVSLSRNAFHISVISDIIRMLSESGIKLVLLKGMALELSVYGNSGLRQMNDIDFLIRHSDYKEARKIMTENGYVSLPVKSLFHKPIIAYTGKHLPTLEKNGVSADMHLELFPGTRNDLTKQIFDGSIELSINNQEVQIPPPQLFFLYLIKHLWTHELNNESQLRLYTDLVILLEKHRDEILNEDLMSLSAIAGMTDQVSGKLMILRDFWSITFPEKIDGFIEAGDKENYKERFLSFLKIPKQNSLYGNKLTYRKTIREIPGFHRKMLFVAGDILPTLSFMKARYGCKSKFMSLFYYPHRLGKILWLLLG